MDHEKGTRAFHNRMVVVFDFDDTLAPATVPWLLEHIGIEDAVAYEHAHCKRLVDNGWDQILSQAPLLLGAAKECGMVLTRELCAKAGRELPVFEGAEKTLPALRKIGRAASEGADVELYILSSGFVEIMGSSRVAKCFDDIWGSALHWDDDNRLIGVKRAVIHSEKARYLLALAKGLDMKGADEPEDVYLEKPMEDWHVPIDQMIYVGDGISDIDAFKLMHEHGGIAIGVDHSTDGSWSAAEHIFENATVENIAPPDFRDGAELQRSLVLAVESIGKRIALRRLATKKRGRRQRRKVTPRRRKPAVAA